MDGWMDGWMDPWMDRWIHMYIDIYVNVCVCMVGNMYFRVLDIYLEYGRVTVVFIIIIIIIIIIAIIANIEVKMYLILSTLVTFMSLTLVDSQNLSSAHGRFSGSPQGGILGHIIVAEECQKNKLLPM